MMRAIVVATGANPGMAPLTDWYPVPMLPLAGRPFIQHIVEYLVERKTVEIEFVLSHLPDRLESFLGDGARWGCVFRYHLSRDPYRPYGVIKAFASSPQPVLLLHADRFPSVVWPESPETPIAFYGPATESAPGKWTGWACVPENLFSALPSGADEDELARFLIKPQESMIRSTAETILSIQTFDELVEANRRVISGAFPVRLITASQSEDGIWISRNVSLHPTAQLTPPVFIGENTRIGEGAQIGPCAVIERDCILDRACIVRNALVFKGSYIGEALELDEGIVDRNRLINLRVGASMSITDDFILGSLSEGHIKEWTGKKFSQAAGIIALLLTWPVMLLAVLLIRLFRRGPVFFSLDAVRLPTTTQPWEWRAFRLWRLHPDLPAAYLSRPGYFRGVKHGIYYLLPGLLSIARGHLRFVGVPPRSREMITALARDWQALYLSSKAGILTEAELQYFGRNPGEDEQYSAEAFYSVTANPGYDLRLMLKYLGRILNPLS